MIYEQSMTRKDNREQRIGIKKGNSKYIRKLEKNTTGYLYFVYLWCDMFTFCGQIFFAVSV
jgi:hypothetical protein